MCPEAHIPVVKKKKRLSIPKSLSIVRCWDLIGPVVAQEIGGPDYLPIPYCYDTEAYKIGHIFVPVASHIRFFRRLHVLKILGPIRDFVARNATNFQWLNRDFCTTITLMDKPQIRIIVEHGKNQITFTGHDCCFLSKPNDMPVEQNVTIDRATHNDLSRVSWFGLITSVVVTKIFELNILKDVRQRAVYIGDNVHPVLFKYEICEIDADGKVVKSRTKKIRCKWLPIKEKPPENLPLSTFQSQAISKA